MKTLKFLYHYFSPNSMFVSWTEYHLIQYGSGSKLQVLWSDGVNFLVKKPKYPV